MERTSSSQSLLEVEGGLKELVLHWCSDTQSSLALDDGNVPKWFQGVTARKDAEDLLKDKDLGTFLVRVSDKTTGYILSYRGLDRCRHFIITQNPDGLFVISGDDQPHSSIGQLIEHYKVSPIQPFGEYLTSCCHQTDTDELYDVVNRSVAEKSGVSVQALRTLWDQKDLQRDRRTQQQMGDPEEPPPALPTKSNTRKLKGAVSAGATCQELPPVPRRGLSLGFSLSGSSLDGTSFYTQNGSGQEERLGGNTNLPPQPGRVSNNNTNGSNHQADWGPPGVEEPEPMGYMSRSPQSLINNFLVEDQDENGSDQLSSSFHPPKRVTCHTYSFQNPRPSSSRSNLEHLFQSNPLYQSTERSCASSAQQGDGMHAEVSQKPGELSEEAYESLEDMKATKSNTMWGKNNIKLKKFLHLYMKK